jgi:hypothetical protein
MPWALSETGPKVSIGDDDADGGQQAAAGQRDANSELDDEPPPSRKAPKTAAPMTSAV